MHVSRRLHICNDVVLQFWERRQLIWHILILLNVANHFSRLRAFGEIDEIGFLDDGWDTVLDEG